MNHPSIGIAQVINETLRMGNVVGGVFRKALQDVEVQGNLPHISILNCFVSINIILYAFNHLFDVPICRMSIPINHSNFHLIYIDIIVHLFNLS